MGNAVYAFWDCIFYDNMFMSTCLSGSILSGMLVKFTILTSTLHFFKVNIVLLPLKYPLTLFGDPCKSILYIGSDVGVHIRLLHACPQHYVRAQSTIMALVLQNVPVNYPVLLLNFQS